jgi:hypothetical protein
MTCAVGILRHREGCLTQDFADVTAVNGLTTDFRFFTSPGALCDNGVTCESIAHRLIPVVFLLS